MPLILRFAREGNSLADVDEASRDFIGSLVQGETRQFEEITPDEERSRRELRWWWALLESVRIAIGVPSKEALHLYLKVRLGYCDLVKMPDGSVVPVEKSIARGKMSHKRFQAFKTDAVQLMNEELLGQVGDCDKERIWRLMDGVR